MNKFKQFIYSKRFIIGIMGVFQLALFFWLTTKLYTVGSATYVLLALFSMLIMLYVFEKDNIETSTFEVEVPGEVRVCIQADGHRGSFKIRTTD